MLGPLVPGMPAQTERSIQAPQLASALPHFVSPIRSMGHALLAMPYTKLPVSAESFSLGTAGSCSGALTFPQEELRKLIGMRVMQRFLAQFNPSELPQPHI